MATGAYEYDSNTSSISPIASGPTVETVGYMMGMPGAHDSKKYRSYLPSPPAPRLKPWAI